MTVNLVSALSAATSVAPVTGTTTGATGTVNAPDGSFGNVLTSAIDSLSTQQSTADDLAVKAVTGKLSDVHDYTIAATEAQLSMELASTLRNKAVDGFNEIMRMQA